MSEPNSITDLIINNAASDGIELGALDDSADILSSIDSTYRVAHITTHASHAALRAQARPGIIDVHCAPALRACGVSTDSTAAGELGAPPTEFPDAVTAKFSTPDWDVADHLKFLDSSGISHAVISISTPGANVFLQDKARTVALARLMNEQSAAYVRAFPSRLSFYASIPLPYTDEAITEAAYALDKLGAVGLILLSNHEGLYLGNAAFRPFFDAIDSRPGKQIIFVHPSEPFVSVNGKLVPSNPTPPSCGSIEFYFETARTFSDLTVSQTIHRFTNIDYIVPHVGGSFPSTLDRLLKSHPNIYDSSMSILQTRFHWDSAGPTHFHQVGGLLAYDIPSTRLLFGTDYPYIPSPTIAGHLAAVQASSLTDDAAKEQLLITNARALFKLKSMI